MPRSPSRGFGDAALLGGTLLALIGLQAALASAPDAGVLRDLLPNLLLVGVGLAWSLKKATRVTLSRGRRPVLASVGLLAALAGVCAFGALWPHTGRHSPTPPLVAILVAPLAEELYFRGAWLDFGARTLGRPAAVVLVSVLFGLVHLPQGLHVLMFAVSLPLCLVALSTGSVVWAFGAHALWNALAVVSRLPPGERLMPVTWAIAAAALTLTASYALRPTDAS